MSKKFFLSPSFWVNVITLVFVGFLVATFVFGWNPPTQAPPGGGGAIQLDLNEDIVVGMKPSPLYPANTRRFIENVETPPQQNGTGSGYANHVATVDYVEAATTPAGGGGGGTSGATVTVWGSCWATTCPAGQNVPLCNTLPNGPWSEVLAGYGPYTYSQRQTGSPYTFRAMDSLQICSTAPEFYLFASPEGGGLNPVAVELYRAIYQIGGTTYNANTCRICAK